MFLLSLAALLRDGYREKNSLKQMKNYDCKYGFNPKRQTQLELASYGITQEDRSIMGEALGRPWVRGMSMEERCRAVYEISLKEGWTYARSGYTPGLENGEGKERIYNSEFQRACSGKSNLNWG